MRRNLVVSLFLTFVMGVATTFYACNNKDDEAVVAAILASLSSTIQISNDNTRIYVINKISSTEAAKTATPYVHKGSLTVVQVLNGESDSKTKLAEIEVGRDPYSVSVNAAGTRAYVSNGADNTVSVIDLSNNTVLTTIMVGSEPRGTALSPSGNLLFVANFSDGTVSIIDTVNNILIKTCELIFQDPTHGPTRIYNPYSLALTNNGNDEDFDESLYVTDFFARPRPGLGVDAIEGFDNGKEGRVGIVSLETTAISSIVRLAPIDNVGFNGDRSAFGSTVFEAPSGTDPAAVPQGAYFNQLGHLGYYNGRLYVPSIGAGPSPPVKFNVNIQALLATLFNGEVVSRANLNESVKTEPNRTVLGGLEKAFFGDFVAIAVRNDVAIAVSRSGSFVAKGAITDGELDFEVTNTIITKFTVGSIPNGVVLNSGGTRAYVNNKVSQNVTCINLETNSVIGSNFATADLPAPGTEAHMILIGELAFFTGFGIPAEVADNADVRNIVTANFRNMASDNNWSSCASCHPNGLADGVTWLFPTGPRQTIPLDGSFSSYGGAIDQRVFNWNAVRSSVTDFNNNARNVQGGFGFTADAQVFAQDPANDPNAGPSDTGLVGNHGANEQTVINNFLGRNPTSDSNIKGVSEALNKMTLWVQKGVRTYNRPSGLKPHLVAMGRKTFTRTTDINGANDNSAEACVACHGGEQWTDSRIDYPLPLFFGGSSTPAASITGVVFLVAATNGPLVSFNGDTIIHTNVGTATLDLTNPIEIRGAGGAIGTASVGAGGSFNSPSLLGAATTGPYGHHGRAQMLEDVFKLKTDGGLEHPLFKMDLSEVSAVVEFLKSIDAHEPFLIP